MFSGRNISDVLTKTTWQGFNPLGLVFVLAWGAAIIAVINGLSGPKMLGRQIAVGIIGLTLALMDLTWRYRESPRDSIWRFSSEFAGGSHDVDTRLDLDGVRFRHRSTLLGRRISLSC